MWHGGKPAGSVYFSKTGYVASIPSSGIYKTFPLNEYEDEEECKRAAEAYRRARSTKLGKTKNMYRIVKNEGESYLEVKFQGDNTFICDVDQLSLIESRHWMATSKTNPSVFSGATKDLRRILLHEAIFGGKCRHIDGNKLNNRLSNLESIKKKERVGPDERNLLEKGWMGGKSQGNITKTAVGYCVRFQKPRVYAIFPFADYDNKEAALKAATEYKLNESDRLGLTKNKYRYLVDSNGMYLEVTLPHNQSFYCDYEDLPLVEKTTWGISYLRDKNRTSYVLDTKQRGVKKLYHRCIVDYEKVDHIDGNGLNNRRYNLREGIIENPKNRRRNHNNKSGVTGVYLNTKGTAWVASWRVNNANKSKRFAISKYGNSELALEAASNYRRQIDEAEGLNLQQRLNK